MKYNNPMTKKLLKEFRKFQKWAPKDCYAMHGDPEAEFNKEITSIVNIYKDLESSGVKK